MKLLLNTFILQYNMSLSGSTWQKWPKKKQKIEGNIAPKDTIEKQWAQSWVDEILEAKKTYQHDKRQATIELKKLIDSNWESIKEVLETTDTHLVTLRNAILSDSWLSLSCGSEDLKKEIDSNFITISNNIEKYWSLSAEQKKEKDSDIDTYHTKLTKLAALWIWKTKEQKPQDEKKEELSRREEKMAYFWLGKYGKTAGNIWSSISYLFSHLWSVIDGAKQWYTQHKNKWIISGIVGWVTWARQSIKQLRSATTNSDNIDRQDEAITINDNWNNIEVVAKEYMTEKLKKAVETIEKTGGVNKKERKIRNLTLNGGHINSFGQSQEIEMKDDGDKKVFMVKGLDIQYPATDKWVEECVLTANLTNKQQYQHQTTLKKMFFEHWAETTVSVMSGYRLVKDVIETKNDRYLYFDDGKLLSSRENYSMSDSLPEQAKQITRKFANAFDSMWAIFGLDFGMTSKADVSVLEAETLTKVFPTMKKNKKEYEKFVNEKIANTSINFTWKD